MARRLDSATRARRLVALLPHLRKGDRIPISDLARAVGCTHEEVTADLAALTMCGIPPFTPFDMVDLEIDGDTVTVYMDPPGLDQPLRLTMAEARALGAALDLAGYSADDSLRGRLAEMCSESASLKELERTVRAGAAPGGAADLYSLLAAAAESHEKVLLTYYTGSTGQVTERVVHPWALVQRTGNWYVVGMCEYAKQERVFRLDRIRSVVRTGEPFVAPEVIPTAVTPDSTGAGVAEILFGAGVPLPDARAWPGMQAERKPDGTAMVRVPYHSAGWMARRVVSYMGHAEAIGPPDVREAARELADEMLHSIK